MPVNSLYYCSVVCAVCLLLSKWQACRRCSQSPLDVYFFQAAALMVANCVSALCIAATPLHLSLYLLLPFALPWDTLQPVRNGRVSVFRPTPLGICNDLWPLAVLLFHRSQWAAAVQVLFVSLVINYVCLAIARRLFSLAETRQALLSHFRCFLRIRDVLPSLDDRYPVLATSAAIFPLLLIAPLITPHNATGDERSTLLLSMSLVRLALQLMLRWPEFDSRRLDVAEKMVQVEMTVPSPLVQPDSCCEIVSTKPVRSLEELCDLLAQTKDSLKLMSNEEVLLLLKKGKVAVYRLENLLADEARAVFLRRQWFAGICSKTGNVAKVPFLGYDYSAVTNSCCENVLGYVPVPFGFAGPLKVDDQIVYVPLCTTEGCLVASINRGCQALMRSNGVRTAVLNDGMSRGPVVSFEDLGQAEQFKLWLEDKRNFPTMARTFDATSRYARLKSIHVTMVGRFVFLRFSATTGDAMGMNMVSKGVEAVLHLLINDYFPKLTLISLSGNYCVDKKPSAINWILGRGKSVTSEALLPSAVVNQVLKTDVDRLVQLNVVKNFVGSAKAGVVGGGFNAHSANIVAAVFASTGQDLAQVVSSSQCITHLEKTSDGQLRVSCTMPCLEVGTVGGGTGLAAQKACLQILGCAGSSADRPGENARRLSRIICGTVMAGELSLLAALSCNQLVSSHLRYNRSSVNIACNVSELPSGQSQLADQLQSMANRYLKTSGVHPQSCSTVFM